MLAIKGVYERGQILLDEQITVENKIPVIVTFLEDIKENKGKTNYYFSDLAGRLEWEGDPVAQQRILRDEW
jgi:hypothetical protein